MYYGTTKLNPIERKSIMATSPTTLHLVNAATKNELKLTKQNGFYKVNGSILSGDLYTDPLDSHVAILVVSRKVPLEELPAIEIAPPVHQV